MKKKLLILPLLAFMLSLTVNLLFNPTNSSIIVSTAYAQETDPDDEKEVPITMDCSAGIGQPNFKSGIGCVFGEIDCTPVHPCK